MKNTTAAIALGVAFFGAYYWGQYDGSKNTGRNYGAEFAEIFHEKMDKNVLTTAAKHDLYSERYLNSIAKSSSDVPIAQLNTINLLCIQTDAQGQLAQMVLNLADPYNPPADYEQNKIAVNYAEGVSKACSAFNSTIDRDDLAKAFTN